MLCTEVTLNRFISCNVNISNLLYTALAYVEIAQYHIFLKHNVFYLPQTSQDNEKQCTHFLKIE